MEICISDKVREASNGNVALGILLANVRVKGHDTDLWRCIEGNIAELRGKYSIDEVSTIPQIDALRETYRALGTKPQKYRGANEALLRRILKGQDLYKINTVVDTNNLLSLSSLRAVATYDLSQIGDTIMFQVGHEGQSYKAIGRDQLNIARLPVLADVEGPFGSPTADSERAKISLNSKDILTVIMSFDGGEGLEAQLSEARQLLIKFCAATSVSTDVVE